MPTVSVIIPAYNHARFLKWTIESVLGQTWRDYEVVVVDDGSKDDTPAVAGQFADRIRYVRQANKGMARTRNAGLQLATGDIISFLDDDDVWLPDYLSSILSRFKADPHVAAVHTGFQLTSDEPGRDFPSKSTRTVPPSELYDTLIEGGFFPPSAVSVRRSVLDAVGFFDENLQGYADWELWLRICRERTFVGVPEVLVKYRIHAGGLSSNAQHMTEDRLKAIRKHFGPPEGGVATWPVDKRRAYAFAYRTAAFEYKMQGKDQEAWCFLQQSASIWPSILARLDTFYEMACGNQPRGYRGRADLLEIEHNGADVLAGLERLFSHADADSVQLRNAAFSNANLALAMLSDQAGMWEAGRRYLARAIKFDSRLIASPSVVRRYTKLLVKPASQKVKHAAATTKLRARLPGR